MKRIILGTAGHIDHGKTSLIRAVTGTDTDRLKEEKLRGITIELGFASLDLPNGYHVGIVDVPGHEKFVKNMVAGASGIDIVAMVIAADEGVMPQTREHMEICTLLGVKHGFVVMTKTDMVDEEWLELAREDITDFMQGTFLEGAPIVPVSSVTGQGIPAFTTTLAALCEEVTERPATGLFRLPVDRVFSMKGFGTVITGTLVSGSIRVGETVMLYPSRKASKVRGIQAHNQSVNEAEAGMRTAINFQGLDKTDVNRGDVVSTPGGLIPSYMIDLSTHYLSSNEKVLKSRSRVRFHTGTSEVLGNLVLLDREELLPGDTAVAQVRLDTPVNLVKDDRFVLRSYSPVRTIGGGQVINPIPPKHKRFRKATIEALNHLSELPPEEIIAFQAREAGIKGVSFTDLKLMVNLPDRKLEEIIDRLLSKRELVQIDKEQRLYLHHRVLDGLIKQVSAHLDAYHVAKPLKAGMPKEELKSKLPSILNTKAFTLMLNQMLREEVIVVDENTVRLKSHKVALAHDQADIRDKILQAYHDSALQPPYFRDLIQNLRLTPQHAKDVLQLLVDEGELVKVKEDLLFHQTPFVELKARLVEFLGANGEITTSQFKEMTKASRKYVIPLIEYFDSTNVTIRIGDVRRLRKG